MMQSDNNFECSCCMIIQYDLTNWDTNTLAEGVVLLTLVTLGCLAASNCQPGITGCPPSQTISMVQAVVKSRLAWNIRHCR